MPDLWYDVDVNLAEVPVNIAPLIDDTDFKTREVALTYDQAGIDLTWNFCTTLGAMTQTAVTPTTGGVHDWAHQGDGMYSIEIPATGGTINNDTEGFGWFTGICTGVLPWRGPICGFRAAAINNSMIDGATVDVNVTAMAANVITATAINTDAIDADALAADAIAELAIWEVKGALGYDSTTKDLIANVWVEKNAVIQNGTACTINIYDHDLTLAVNNSAWDTAPTETVQYTWYAVLNDASAVLVAGEAYAALVSITVGGVAYAGRIPFTVGA